MDRLKSLEIFAAVAERSSFAQAGRALDLSAPVVTRAVQELEQHLGLRLLQRSTRRVWLTREGEDTLARARALLAAYEELAAVSRQHQDEMAGSIRLSAPASFGAARLAPLVADFLAAHPRVRIDLELDDALALEQGGADLALRVAWTLPDHLVARRVGRVPFGVYAAPAYLRRRGLPRHPDELADHDCLVHSGPQRAVAWQFSHPVSQERCRPALQVLFSANHVEALLSAARRGAGLALLPRVLADPLAGRGELQPVLAAWECPAPGVYLTYLAREHQPLRVRRLVEHLVLAFERDAELAPVRLERPQPAAAAMLH